MKYTNYKKTVKVLNEAVSKAHMTALNKLGSYGGGLLVMKIKSIKEDLNKEEPPTLEALDELSKIPHMLAIDAKKIGIENNIETFKMCDAIEKLGYHIMAVRKALFEDMEIARMSVGNEKREMKVGNDRPGDSRTIEV